MTRNVKRFLAGSLLSLTPSIAFAGQLELEFPDFLSQRTEYVSVREGAVQLPVRKGPSMESGAAAAEDFFVFNGTSPAEDIYLGLQLVTGRFNGIYGSDPVLHGTYGGFQIGAPAFSSSSMIAQEYYYTNETGTKACVWRLEVTDVGGACSAQVFYGTYGGAVCTVDATQSFVNPTTCQTQLVTNMQ